MTAHGVPAFDRTVEKTQAWLKHLEAALGWDDRQRTYSVLRGVLHAVRDRLPPQEAVDLAAQLPMLVRGFFFEGWRLAGKPRRYRHKREFLAQFAREAPWLSAEDHEQVVTAGFALLASELGNGETEQVRASLPAELRELWPRPGL
jgi:uncharacterized protein (DUF2267 family)